MEPIGYPVYFLYLILLIGIPLSLFRPFKAFLLVVFLTAAANANAFTYTRTPLLGPYFNANDACLLIALLAMMSYAVMPKVVGKYNAKNKNIIIGPAKWIIVILLIGFVQSWFVMGWTYEVLRALRWAITLPVYFIIAATMVDKKDKVRPLLLALFLGSLVSVFEHFFFVQSRMSLYQLYGDIGQFRTITFHSPGLWLLLAGLVWLPETKFLRRPVLIGAGVLFAVSTILNQTRSVWISSIAVLPVTFLLFRQKKIIVKAVVLPFVLLVLYGGISLTMHYTTPNISPGDIIMPRLNALFQGDMINESTITRRLDFEREIEEWSQGTLILGRGLAYFTPYSHRDISGRLTVAWGHLGHVTTLAQLGLIGLFVYSIYLPFIIIQASRKIWIEASDEVKFLGLFAGLTMIWCWICFLMSSSFLGQYAAAGVIFGAAWRQAMLLKTDKAAERKSQPDGILRRLVPRRIVW